jgi:hypothetical protein
MAPSATRATGASATNRVLDRLAARRDDLIERYVQMIVPGVDPSRAGDLQEAAELTIDAFLVAIRERRALTREDVLFVRPYFRHAMLRGAKEAEMLRACRQFQRVAWDALIEIAGDSAAGRAVVAELSRPLLDYVEVFSEIAVETYQEVSDAMAATSRNARQELVEDLLAGRVPTRGVKLDILRSARLDAGRAFVVLSAVPKQPLDRASLTLSAATLMRAPGDGIEPLVAVREEEIVVIRAVHDDAERFVANLDAVRLRLQHDQILLGIGVSAVHVGLDHVPAGYDDAWQARERTGPDGGLLALVTMSALDYLLVRGGDRAAWELVPERIRRFIEDDLAGAGLLVDSLMAYVECNMNAKLAAERLFIHHNTAFYRLAKIAELTGCDLRRQSDLLELIIAVRLAGLNVLPDDRDRPTP